MSKALVVDAVTGKVTEAAPAYSTTIDLAALASMYVQNAWQQALAAGYDTGRGYVMQCDKLDYEMLRDGLQTVLDAPIELGGAGGDATFTVAVVDKDNQPHQMTIAEAQQLAAEVQRYYWQLWARKQAYRQALTACQTVAEMEQVQF